MTDKRKIDVLKIIQEGRDKMWSLDYESLNKKGYDSGFLKGMVQEGFLGWSGADFYITDKGDSILRDYLLIESKKQDISKTKVVFDSNIYNRIADGELDISLLEKNKDKFEFYITHIQVDEINKCPDTEKRARLSLIKTKIAPILVPTESIVFGVSRWNECKFSDGKTLENLRKGNEKHTEDALIGEVAIKNSYLLVTDDEKIRKRVNSNGGKAISLAEFKKMLTSP